MDLTRLGDAKRTQAWASVCIGLFGESKATSDQTTEETT